MLIAQKIKHLLSQKITSLNISTVLKTTLKKLKQLSFKSNNAETLQCSGEKTLLSQSKSSESVGSSSSETSTTTTSTTTKLYKHYNHVQLEEEEADQKDK